MRITRDVVTDLLPAYLAGEASADTRALVEEFARQDAEFARALEAQRSELAEGARALREPAAALSPDHELRTLARTRSMAERLRWLMAAAIMLTAFPLSFVFEGGRLTFLLVRDVPVLAMACWASAVVLWVLFFSTRRGLRASGL
jgi:predicted anti-sigma-YlaC factor YlaD